LSVADCLEAVDECGAPVVSIAGGEPLLHKEMPEIVTKILARKKFVYLCTNALLLEKKLDQYKPHPFFTWDIHLDGDREMHDRAVSQDGTYDRAIAAIKAAKARGFRVSINCTLFDGADPERVARFFDEVTAMGIDGIMTSPGYAYERAPDQAHFLGRQKTKQLFRDILSRGKGRGWKFGQSPLFIDFLAGNQEYHCTPWGNPTRNVFGWQRPCYLLGEGYAKSFKELMVHSGYEATAVVDSVKNPLKIARVLARGPKLEGAMAPEISLDHQRPAEYVFSRHVEDAMRRVAHGKPGEMADAAD
jgi:hopanoid biosynthesis associated radical SAM protein HpnH